MRISTLIVLVIVLISCATLQAQKPVFIKRELESLLRHFEWITETIAYASDDKFTYLTQDSGKTWNIQNSNLCGTENCVSKVIRDPNQPKHVFFIAPKGKPCFYTNNVEDKEPKYERIQIEGRNIVQFQFHPTDPYRALALVERQDDEHYDLFVTSNCCTGSSYDWRLAASDISSASFGSKDADSYDPYKLYGIRHHEPGLLETVKARTFFFSMDMDNPSSLVDVVPHGFEMFYAGKFLFVAAVDRSEKISLLVSSDNGKQFNNIQLQFEYLKQEAYTVLDGSQGAVFLNVFHNQFKGEPWGNVYLSDSSGIRYTISITHNRRAGSSCDFHKIKSMEGVYAANIVNNLEDPDCQSCENYRDCNAKCRFVSRITYDKGGQWQHIEAPYVDSTGKTFECSEKLPSGRCPLHLHGFASSGISPIQSHHSAVGLVMASGNVGSFLTSSRIGEVSAFFSRDAGLTWDEVAKGPHVFDFANHGAIMVAAQSGLAVDSILFSWNEGQTWITSNFTAEDTPNQKISVTKIRVPHNPITKSVIIEGVRNGKTVLMHADFSAVLDRPCQGIDNPTDPLSDYEYYQPTSYDNNCLLGRKIKYVRRKRLARCHNPQVVEKPLVVSNCQCTASDFECDFGYEKKWNTNGQSYCSLIPGTNEEALKKAPKPCFRYYNETRGYRKIAGNTCVGGVDLDPIVRQCPQGFGAIGVLILLIFTCPCCILAGFILCRKNCMAFLFGGKMDLSGLNLVSYAPVGNDGSTALGFEDGEEEEPEPEEVNEDNIQQKRQEAAAKQQQQQQQQQEDEPKTELAPPPPSNNTSSSDDFKVVKVVRKV